MLRHLIAAAPPGSLGPSARFAGFADSLAGALTEIEASLLDPEDLGPGLAELTRAYRAELERLAVRDRGMVRRRAVERLTSELGVVERRSGLRVRLRGPDGRGVAPDRGARGARRGARLAAVRARPGGVRLAVAHGRRPRRARGRRHRRARCRAPTPTCRRASPISSATSSTTPPRRRRSTARCASSRAPAAAPRSSSSPRPCSSSSATASRPEEIAIVCPSLERSRASIETAFGALGVPVSIEARPRLAATAFGQALLSLLRFAWGNGTRRELFSFLRTPYARARPQRRRLPRGPTARARRRPRRPHDRGDDEAAHRPPAADARAARRRGRAARRRPGGRARDAAQRVRPRRSSRQRRLRSATSAPPKRRRVILDELERLQAAGIAIRTEDVLAALDRATVRGDAAGEPGRVAVLDLARARTRSFEAVFVIGLEQGSLPRRDPTSPFFDDETRRELDAARGARLQRPDAASRDRYLFYTACTRPRKPAHARARGGHRRRLAARAEPVLGGGVRALRRRRRAPAHDAAAARPAHVADRGGSDRARAAARARAPRRRRSARGERARVSRTAGSASSAARAARSRGRRRSAIPARWRCSRSRETFRVTDLERMAAAPRPGSSSATSARAGSTRRSTR